MYVHKKAAYLKILHILGSGRLVRNPDAGALSGVVRTALEVAKRQAALGHTVYVVGFGGDSWTGEWSGVKLVSLKESAWLRIRFAGRQLDFSRHIPLVLYTLSTTFDVVHTHMHPYLRWIRGRLKVAHMHIDPLSDASGAQLAYRRVGLKQLARQADVVVAVSRFVQETMREDIPANQIRVVYNGGGVAPEQWEAAQRSRQANRARLKIAPDAVVVLYVGAFVPAKGVHHLAHSFVALSDVYPEAHLALAGGEGLWKSNGLNSVKVEGYTGELQVALASLPGRIHFLGLVASSNMAETYALADIVVMPSVCREAFGIAALEGMSCGLPVIASASGGLLELVGDDRGLLVPPGDEQALSAAMMDLVGDPEMRRTLGERGRKYAGQAQFSWDRAAEELLDLYSEYLGGS